MDMDNKFEKIRAATYYLQMIVNPKLQTTLPPDTDFGLFQNPTTDSYLKIYTQVGSKWGWAGRLIISETELEQIINHENNYIFLLTKNNVTIGFAEMMVENNEVEIVYIGLIPNFIGKGYGKILLQQTIKEAWKLTSKRVWLHTCEHDHKKALEIYQRAGFIHYDSQIENHYYPANQ